MKKSQISKFFRIFYLIYFIDKIRFYYYSLIKYSEIKQFKKNNPLVNLPPANLVYESFALNYSNYYFGGEETAVDLMEKVRPYISLENLNILEWGCGPARIVRHLPRLLPNCFIYGSDYNKDSINWNKKNIPFVNFNLNDLNPPLPYTSSSFDLVYGVSIFTHLSEDLHDKWLTELIRITKNDGIILLTLHGISFKEKLSFSEAEQFDLGKLVIRGNTKIGHRTFVAFHPKSYVLNFFSNHEILEHEEGKIHNNKPEQDIWIIKVKKN